MTETWTPRFPRPSYLDEPGAVSWNSTAGIIKNGGLRPPGTEGKVSPKGKPKSGQAKVEKDTYYSDTASRKPPGAVPASEKAITQDRVISEGLYTYQDTQVRVRVSQSSNKPYGLVLRDGDWEYTPGIVSKLKASDKVEGSADSTPKVTEGFYRYGAGVAEVVRSGAGRLYAKILDVQTGQWAYSPGTVNTLKAEDRLTLAGAAALGKKWHRCMCCGRELTNPESIDYGIGPICREKL
jgi:hypothetical protein